MEKRKAVALARQWASGMVGPKAVKMVDLTAALMELRLAKLKVCPMAESWV